MEAVFFPGNLKTSHLISKTYRFSGPRSRDERQNEEVQHQLREAARRLRQKGS